ncbi:MAG: hypothetical protein ACYDAL_02450 [Candidatus Dormibacteraceae bacterium]
MTATLLTITIPFGPVALQLGPLATRWYRIACAMAFPVGGKLGLAHTRRPTILDQAANVVSSVEIITWPRALGQSETES